MELEWRQSANGVYLHAVPIGATNALCGMGVTSHWLPPVTVITQTLTHFCVPCVEQTQAYLDVAAHG